MISIDEVRKNSDKVEADYQEKLKATANEIISTLKKNILEKSVRSRERLIDFSSFNTELVDVIACYFEKAGFKCEYYPIVGILTITW